MRRLAAVLLVAASACRGHGGGASCGQVAASFMAIARGEVARATLDDGTRRAVGDQLPAMRDALAKSCSDGGWSATVRDCLARAADHAAIQVCEQQLTDTQRQALDRAARGESAPAGETNPTPP